MLPPITYNQSESLIFTNFGLDRVLPETLYQSLTTIVPLASFNSFAQRTPSEFRPTIINFPLTGSFSITAWSASVPPNDIASLKALPVEQEASAAGLGIVTQDFVPVNVLVLPQLLVWIKVVLLQTVEGSGDQVVSRQLVELNVAVTFLA